MKVYKSIFWGVFFALLQSSEVLAETFSTYEGKIKSIYLHERLHTPYFGIELEGTMDKNPCGDSLKYFIKNPETLNDRHLSMLLAAHASGKVVVIQNADTTVAQRCHSNYPTFNFVKVK
ncbi:MULTISPECIES: hypothetical protein [Vibrio]|uniref:hypothetical protein n=1 Tax=Vibrio TaxID=662 RepID=UPI002075B36E|nr:MULTISPECIES: hypothetical protein [Vibrio]USD33664.1 hypothetical protein J8Z27_06050 [Vibrio sp. SCSIO 43186]USD46733.1 hypothetical protein J4N38_06230 [Vibrio sp. SCSIO 43145]USD70789.1 hypothetical protein J4N41_06050 [Vibrio sp. SCSIO 43139]USD95705.1 hypothetical protein CTT30_06135 [Vibrio coralliilyticus]